jgi:acyl dehydratase
MKISAAIVGQSTPVERVEIDKRWIMAYNAALGAVSATPHPLFPVCYEWTATRALREASGLQALNARLVHAQHDLRIQGEVKEGILSVRARIVAAEQRRPGTFVTIRLEARGPAGDPVSTTDYGMLYRGVELDGASRALERLEDPPRHASALKPLGEVAVAATAAHVYTECARIWNPIHTDPEYARGAGLPGIILHGTATLALSVSRLAEKRVRRVRCRFAGMVLMPSTLTVHASRENDEVVFETRNERGEAVIERGWIS